jgi:hypothetical protein
MTAIDIKSLSGSFTESHSQLLNLSLIFGRLYRADISLGEYRDFFFGAPRTALPCSRKDGMRAESHLPGCPGSSDRPCPGGQ